MRSRLTPDALLLGAVLLMTLGIAIFAVDSGRTQEDESLERRTTYSSRPGGYRAERQRHRIRVHRARPLRSCPGACRHRGPRRTGHLLPRGAVFPS